MCNHNQQFIEINRKLDFLVENKTPMQHRVAALGRISKAVELIDRMISLSDASRQIPRHDYKDDLLVLRKTLI